MFWLIITSFSTGRWWSGKARLFCQGFINLRCYVLMLLLFSCLVVSNSFLTLWAVCSPPEPGSVALSMGFPKQEKWSELPFPSPEDLPGPGMKPASPALELDFFTTESQGVDEWTLTLHFSFITLFAFWFLLHSLVLRDQFCCRSVYFQEVCFPEVWHEEIDLFLSFLLWNDTTELIILYYLYLFLCFINLVPKISWSPFCFLLYSCGKSF